MPPLIASPIYPYPANRGDKLRWYAMLSILAPLEPLNAVFAFMSSRDTRNDAFERLFHSVRIVPASLFDVAWSTALLELTGRPSVFGRLASPSWRSAVQREAGSASSVLLLSASALAVPDLPAPTVVDLIDVKSRVRTVSGDHVARRSLAAEVSLARRFRVVLATESDKEWLMQHRVEEQQLIVIPNGVDARLFAADTDASSRILLFVGNLRYAPNSEGLRWFLRSCWPALRARHEGLTLRVVGYGADRFGERAPGMEIYANVADMTPHYESAAVAIAPLLTASGVQNKVLEAMAAGLPVVCTTPVARGLFDDHPAVVTDDSDAFVQACRSLALDPARRGALGASGRDYARRHHDWGASARLLGDALRDGPP